MSHMLDMIGSDLDILTRVANKNKLYLNNEIDIDGRCTIETAWEIVGTLREEIPEIKGGFGVGFPFHSLTQTGKLIPNPEFTRYVNEFIGKVETTRNLGYTAWHCFTCQLEDVDYSPINCKSCGKTFIKPRDVMKVMPDVDIFLIADKVTDDLLMKIQDVSIDHAFHQSDISAYETLYRIDRAFENIETGNNKVRFPGDMHVVSMDGYTKAMQMLSNGIVDLDIDVYSLHHQWVLNRDIDFAFDVIFSSTFNPEICESEISKHEKIAKTGLSEKYSEDDILEIVKKKSKRANALLSHEPSLQAFIERVRSWVKND